MTEKKVAPEEAEESQMSPTTKVGTNIVQRDDYTVKYDVDMLNDFLDHVFHVEHGEVYCQLSKKAPRGFGNERSLVIRDILRRSEAPMQGYFSTASLNANEDGTLRHTREAFAAMHVLVLDDIGTKIDASKWPEAFVENYQIESSPGNFQRGFILRKPITDYEEAQALINLFVDAGMTDKGGAMPVKKVRLPCGVNGKKGPNARFPVRLTHPIDPQSWDIQELLDAAGIDVQWETYRADIDSMPKRTKRLGSSAWNPDLHYVDPHTGVYDPLLEWLYEQGMVIEDGAGPFLEVLCPFSDRHTDHELESLTCGYSPLGHGMYPHKRVFFCFHSHGAEHQAKHYIEQLHAMGAPLVPDTEYAPEDMLKYIFDVANDRVFDCTSDAPVPLKVEAVNRATPSVFLPTKNGARAVAPLPLWLKQPSSVKVMGTVRDAANPNRILTLNGERVFNMASRPDYPTMKPDPAHVDIFCSFVKYLIPDDAERDYFLDWLTMKVRDPSFRGSAMVLISQIQGVGKNVLFSILRALFGLNNSTMVSMETLIHPNNGFNEYMGSLFCCISETMALDDPKTIHRAYNKLKEIVDPAAEWVDINYKFGLKVRARTATSFLFFSNNTDAISLPRNDRRFFVMSGPHKAQSAEYYADLCAWRDGDEWRAHLWNWLKAREVDEAKMFAPAPMTHTRRDMHDQSTPVIEHVVQAAIDLWPSALVPFPPIRELLIKYTADGVPDDPVMRKKWAERIYRQHTMSLRKHDDLQSRIHGMRHSVKLHAANVQNNKSEYYAEVTRASEALKNYDEDAFKRQVDAQLADALDMLGD